MHTRLVLNTLEEVLLKRTCEQGELILHSDLGSQYIFQAYEESLKDVWILHSFRKKGCPYDNAGMESFHASIKKERIYFRPPYGSFVEIQTDTFDYITIGKESIAPSRISYLSNGNSETPPEWT